jgi:GLE1-like protein
VVAAGFNGVGLVFCKHFSHVLHKIQYSLRDAAAIRCLCLHCNVSLQVAAFVKRMKNLACMLAAMSQTPVKQHRQLQNAVDVTTFRHPFPLSESWKWLARLLNQVSYYINHVTVSVPIV